MSQTPKAIVNDAKELKNLISRKKAIVIAGAAAATAAVVTTVVVKANSAKTKLETLAVTDAPSETTD